MSVGSNVMNRSNSSIFYHKETYQLCTSTYPTSRTLQCKETGHHVKKCVKVIKNWNGLDLHIVPTWSVGAGVGDRAGGFAGGPDEAGGGGARAGPTAHQLLVAGTLCGDWLLVGLFRLSMFM